MPVSITATLTVLRWCTREVVAAPMRRIPGGNVSPVAIGVVPAMWTALSSVTYSTRGSFRSAATVAGVIAAAYPFSADEYTWSADTPYVLAWDAATLRTAVLATVSRSTTMYRPGMTFEAWVDPASLIVRVASL